MPISSLPSGGPSLPGGAQKVSLKDISTDTTTAKVDVTVLGDSQREYDDPPLEDGNQNGVSATCTASGLLDGTGPEVDPVQPGQAPTGWVCEEAEISYEVGKYATWSASWSYYD